MRYLRQARWTLNDSLQIVDVNSADVLEINLRADKGATMRLWPAPLVKAQSCGNVPVQFLCQGDTLLIAWTTWPIALKRGHRNETHSWRADPCAYTRCVAGRGGGPPRHTVQKRPVRSAVRDCIGKGLLQEARYRH